MSAWEALEAMLRTDPRDAGCAETFEMIHAYAEILVEGGDPDATMPGITAHLETCGPCAEDYLGLLEALRRELGTEVED